MLEELVRGLTISKLVIFYLLRRVVVLGFSLVLSLASFQHDYHFF
jgi:hypothetical protein